MQGAQLFIEARRALENLGKAGAQKAAESVLDHHTRVDFVVLGLDANDALRDGLARAPSGPTHVSGNQKKRIPNEEIKSKEKDWEIQASI